MPQFLIELGTEELPATAVKRAYTDLSAKLVAALQKEGLLAESATATQMGAPRRLIVAIDQVATRQADSEKKQRGPGLKGAYDAAGNPTPALIGFCRGQGVAFGDVWQDGQYTWVTKQVPGRSAIEILGEAIPSAIRSLTFDKTMRWGAEKMRFARPIRWLLATFGGEVVPCEIAGIKSGDSSHGHRFYAPQSFRATTLETLLDGLRERNVEPDPERRREMILTQLPVHESETPEISPALLDENIFLTEWPTPILGEFEESFLDLPGPVLTTVMAKHEKMFPVRTAGGDISSRFIFVRNSGQDDSVRKGCEWVLNARMNDAKFFFDEDLRSSLDDFLANTKGIVFQEKLGSVYDRTQRLENIAGFCAIFSIDSPTELEYARLAGKYSKADLSTGLVSELASLQGVIGGIYAKRAELPEPVCEAISRQYELSNPSPPQTAADRTASRLVIADQLDKLAGYLGIGLEPSGSSDPYGLRRSVTALIEVAWAWPEPLPPYSHLLHHAIREYEAQNIELDRDLAEQALGRLFLARYTHLLAGVRHDILEAAGSGAGITAITSPKSYRFRTHLLERLSGNESFVQSATRPLNILAAAEKKGLQFESEGNLGLNEMDALDSPTGEKLYHLAQMLRFPLEEAIRTEDEATAADLVLRLESPINRFFEATMVMAEDPATRYARLTVVNRVSRFLLRVGDFTKIVFSGEGSAQG
jgi:glycyl-tRNA synthetase beta chain